VRRRCAPPVVAMSRLLFRLNLGFEIAAAQARIGKEQE
jgi:hypothetical protein